MFAKRTFTFVAIILALCYVTACTRSLNKEEVASLDSAAEQKLQTATKIFESSGIKAAADYCEKESSLTIGSSNFIIDCTVASNFYKPEEDVVRIEGNKTILPISLYVRVDQRSVSFLDEGYQFRNTTLSAFARPEKEWFKPVVTKEKNYK